MAQFNEGAVRQSSIGNGSGKGVELNRMRRAASFSVVVALFVLAFCAQASAAINVIDCRTRYVRAYQQTGPSTWAMQDSFIGSGNAQASPDALSNITVEAIEIAYYGPPEAVSESHYKPIYVFHLILADGTAGEWLISAFDAEG